MDINKAVGPMGESFAEQWPRSRVVLAASSGTSTVHNEPNWAREIRIKIGKLQEVGKGGCVWSLWLQVRLNRGVAVL
jgi:hypothetical protein